jgi:hypothetical protein
MGEWLTFATNLIWQVILAMSLVALYRSGLLRKLVEFRLTPQGIILKLQEKQEELRRDVDTLAFLVSGFVTDWELEHLRKLAASEPFPYQWGGSRDDRFLNELIRLRDLGLIKRNLRSMWDLPREGNLKDFIEITSRGREYLRIRDQLAEGSTLKDRA